jgi:hypothetical protein
LPSTYIPKAPRKTPWQEKKEKTERIEKMQEAVAQLQSDAGWQKWIRSHKSLTRFSYYNRLLVMLQVPDKRAKHSNDDHMTRTQFQVAAQDAPFEVRTYNAWKAQGRQVKRGEKSLMVLKPIFKKMFVDSDGHEVPRDMLNGTEQEISKLVGFTGLKEFDITQTEGDIPQRAQLRGPDGNDLEWAMDKLIAHMETEGYSIERNVSKKVLGSAYGDANIVGKRIRLREKQSVNQEFMVLVHEIAHTRESELGKKIDYTNYSRQDAEVIVQTATAMVGEHVGLNTDGFTLPYLAGWARPEDLDVFKRFTQTIDKIATEIEKIIDYKEKDEGDNQAS